MRRMVMSDAAVYNSEKKRLRMEGDMVSVFPADRFNEMISTFWSCLMSLFDCLDTHTILALCARRVCCCMMSSLPFWSCV